MINNKKVDLHIHTKASDGTWNINELLNELQINKISIFSITDHDTVQMVKKFSQTDLNIEKVFIPGIEISSTFDAKEFHITSYGFDIQNKDLLNLINYNKKVRNEFNNEIIYYFEKLFNKNLINKYYDYQNDNSRGGWKALNFLIDYNLITGIHDLFDKISDMEEKMIFLPPNKVIDIVHKAEGFTFLAHPGAYYDKELLDKDFLIEWIEMGIDGIEAYSPYLNKLNDAKYYIEFCKSNDLMISGGSDSHGSFIKKRKIGKPNIFLNDININKLLNKLKEGDIIEFNR
jgi:predicted metal-dependent phosphoesterase TrpH